MSEVEIDKDVAANWRQLREERGWSWEQLAASIDHVGDTRTVAWMRAQSDGDATSAPKQRRSASKSEA